jgi:transcriptional regulator with XRE-family HTH domain
VTGDGRAAEIGRRVRACRRARGLRQADIAPPFTNSYVSAIEQGRALPSLRALWLLAGHLGVQAEDLIAGVNGLGTAPYNPRHGATAEEVDHRDEDPTPRRRR